MKINFYFALIIITASLVSCISSKKIEQAQVLISGPMPNTADTTRIEILCTDCSMTCTGYPVDDPLSPCSANLGNNTREYRLLAYKKMVVRKKAKGVYLTTDSTYEYHCIKTIYFY